MSCTESASWRTWLMTVRDVTGVRKETLKWDFGDGSTVLVDNKNPVTVGR